MRYISDIIKDEFKQWTNHKPILISAPTGSGKTTFILKHLLPYVKEQGKYLVYFVNRSALKEQINNLIELSGYDYEHFLKVAMHSAESRNDYDTELLKKEKLQHDKRIAELDNIIKKLFEQLAVGNLTDERFRTLTADYEAEQSKLKKRCEEISTKLNEFSSQSNDIDRFIAVVKKYSHIEELTPEIVSEFIDKILIHEAEKDENGHRIQRVDVHFNCVGVINGNN